VRKLALILCLVPGLHAGEYAVLQNGFRIRAQRHEVSDSTIRLYTDTGTLDMPAANVRQFEQEEYVPSPPPKPEPPKPVAETPVPVIQKTPQELLTEAADKHGLRPEFVRSVASAESAYRVNAISPKGAIGLMQLMPGTAADLGVDPNDPKQNAEAGARYLRSLLDKYKNTPDPVRLALAAYNAGPGAVDKYGNIPPYRETQVYVERVLRQYLKQLQK
jgi:soluble lytic murein transglycosylase-like protein